MHLNLDHTVNTVMIGFVGILRTCGDFPAFIGGGRPQTHLRALLQAPE